MSTLFLGFLRNSSTKGAFKPTCTHVGLNIEQTNIEELLKVTDAAVSTPFSGFLENGSTKGAFLDICTHISKNKVKFI